MISQIKMLALFFEDFGRILAGFGTVTFFLNGNVYNGVFVRNSRGPETQRVLGTQKNPCGGLRTGTGTSKTLQKPSNIPCRPSGGDF